MSNTKKKNGKIEFLRFVFCIYVLLFHFYKYGMGELKFNETGLIFYFFPHGSMGVEFFFFLSGLLMAMSVYKTVNTQNALTDDRLLSKSYVNFITKKIMAFFPYHIFAFVLVFICFITNDVLNSDVSTIANKTLSSIPSFFLFKMSGINLADPNSVEWYLSSMVFCMMIIYPVLRRYYYRFSRYWAPLIGILLLGYMVKTSTAVTGVETWTGFTFKGNLRAFAEICLGIFAFEICRYLNSLDLSKKSRVALTALEWFAFIASAMFVMMTFKKKYEILCLIAIFVLVVLSFSSQTYGQKIFNNKFFYYLGSLSLPIYLSQSGGSRLLSSVFADYPMEQKFIVYMAATAVITVIVKTAGKKLANSKIAGKIIQATAVK